MKTKTITGSICILILVASAAIAGQGTISGEVRTIEVDGRVTNTSGLCDTNKFFVQLGTPPQWYWGNTNDESGKQILNIAIIASTLGDSVSVGYDSASTICASAYKRINFISLLRP